MFQRLRWIAMIAWLAPASVATAEQAHCDCDASCPGRADPLAEQVYEDETHRLWYEIRFWTGACNADLWWCWQGPSWYDLMDDVLARAKPADRAELCPRLYALGVTMGHEWARDNDIRRIHTADLKAWRAVLRDAPNARSALEDIEVRVADRLK